MSLLSQMNYNDYKRAKALTLEQCKKLVALTNFQISFDGVENAGEHLIKELDFHGYTKVNYSMLLLSLQRFKPQAKIAILIANDKYNYLSNLATPSTDCDSLGSNLKMLGFIVIIIKNTTGRHLRAILTKLSESIPEDSYCFVFYAGHGCQLGNTKFMLGVDCPTENVEPKHCVTENYLMKALEKCKLDLVVLIMDMCRVPLDSDTNPNILMAITTVEDYIVHNNLFICYSTQPSKAAYEMVQIECSSVNDNTTYQLKTGDSKRILSGTSVYVNALCTRFEDDCDISALLDRVHVDVERSLEKQRPIKVQCGTEKRYLQDVAIGDTPAIISRLNEAVKHYQENCNIL